MAFAENEAKAFLMDLVKKPEFPAAAIATVYREVITFHNEMFPCDPVEAELKRKKRRRAGPSWPIDAGRQTSAQRTVAAADPDQASLFDAMETEPVNA
jgi:hypothetical protein